MAAFGGRILTIERPKTCLKRPLRSNPFRSAAALTFKQCSYIVPLLFDSRIRHRTFLAPCRAVPRSSLQDIILRSRLTGMRLGETLVRPFGDDRLRVPCPATKIWARPRGAEGDQRSPLANFGPGKPLFCYRKDSTHLPYKHRPCRIACAKGTNQPRVARGQIIRMFVKGND
jgi:hypothetical protein